jgi:hypothetical protein
MVGRKLSFILLFKVFQYFHDDGYLYQIKQAYATHPGMYPYFNIQRNPLQAVDDFNQTASGLILIDTTNRTMRDHFFQPWADCARNDDCISPQGVMTFTYSKTPNYFNGSEYW